MTAYAVAQEWHMETLRVTRSQVLSKGNTTIAGNIPLPSAFYTAPVDSEVAIVIPENMKCGLEATATGQLYWARLEGKPGRFLEWKGKVYSEEEILHFKTSGAARIFVQSATNVPIVIRTTLIPK
jgi:hypothetical protein